MSDCNRCAELVVERDACWKRVQELEIEVSRLSKLVVHFDGVTERVSQLERALEMVVLDASRFAPSDEKFVGSQRVLEDIKLVLSNRQDTGITWAPGVPVVVDPTLDEKDEGESDVYLTS